MKRGWIGWTVVRFALVAYIAFAGYVTKSGTEHVWVPFKWLAESIHASPGGHVFRAALFLAIFEVLERALSAYGFRRDRVQRVLGQMVADLLGGDTKNNRATVFRAVRGYQAVAILLWRLPMQTDIWASFKDVARAIPFPWRRYLVVYARPYDARGRRSCAYFRVDADAERFCEGVAGKVWAQDLLQVDGLPPIPPGSCRKVGEIGALPVGDAVRIYAERTYAKAHQMRAREHLARHYLGASINGVSGQGKWGVLLIDSTSEEQPWPTGLHRKKGNHLFRGPFDVYVKLLSNLLT